MVVDGGLGLSGRGLAGEDARAQNSQNGQDSVARVRNPLANFMQEGL